MPSSHHTKPDLREGVVLVLGSGGARGLAHIGVLMALEEDEIPILGVVGSSMGAQIGTAYAFGHSVYHLASEAGSIRRHHVWSSILSRRILSRHLHRLFGEGNLCEASFPVVVVATNLRTGEPMVFDRGSAKTLVRASISIPGLFPPVTYQHQTLVDGAISAPLPVAIARQHFPGLPVVAVSVCHHHLTDIHLSDKPGRFATLQRSLQGTHRQLLLQHLERYPADMLLTPEIPDVDTLDLHKAHSAVTSGYQTAKAALAQTLRKTDTGPKGQRTPKIHHQ